MDRLAHPGGRPVQPGSRSIQPGRGPATGGTATTGASRAGTPGRAGKGGNTSSTGSGAVRGGNLGGLAKLKKENPERSREILVAGNRIARLQDRGLAAGVAVVGGVYAPGAYVRGSGGYGGNNCYYDDWYWNSWGWGYRGGYYNGWNGWWNNCCWDSWWWCWWGCYQSCYYPYWYQFYRPYCYSYPSYYSTVIYRTVYEDVVEETTYVEQPPAEEVSYTVLEPVGEAVLAGGGSEFPAAADQSPLSAAAERYLTLGDRSFREGRYADAVQFYAKAVDFAPDQGALYLVLCDALFAAGDYHYAAYAVRKAFELEPSLAEAVVDKHTFYLDPAEFDRQLAVAEQYVIDHATDRDARLVLALNMLFGGRPAVAVDLYDATAAPAASLVRDQAAELILRVAREVQYGAVTSNPGD